MQSRTVRTHNLTGRNRIAGKSDLVSSGEDRDARPLVNRQPRHVHCRCEADVARGQAATGAQPDLTFAEIDAGAAYMAACGHHFGSDDLFALCLGVLLDENRIAAFGQSRAREDADGLSGAEAAIEKLTRSDRADLP